MWSSPEDAIVDATTPAVAGAVTAAEFAGGRGFRFVVLEQLGRGGMGAVYAAYDPQLDRSVALKVIDVPARSRAAAVSEAKMLARLSHPNVVPVFDVGVHDERVYIVMELVRGVTLRAWVKQRSVRQIVEIYLQAGAGLAAAHAAGLVHRDFKPDNAIVGSDGRVRVVDFGLACEAERGGGPGGGEQATGEVAGTLRYMAPEQAEGRFGPASDQFSFCVSLAEAVEAVGAEPPRWLAEVLARGRAAEPAQRFASTQELLRALGRDRARIRRRRIGLAALVAALAVAFVVGGRSGAVEGPAPCSGGDAEIATAWPRAVREAQIGRIAKLGAYGGELAQRIAAAADGHAARWAAEHRDACLAHRRGAESDAQLDRRMVCLARSRTALAAVAEITAAAEAKLLPDVARAASALPDPSGCDGRAGGEVEPPAPGIAARVAELRGELERARVQLAAGRSSVAGGLAHSAAGELRRLGYPPLLAEALLVEGHAAMRADREAAIATLREASAIGFAAHTDAVAIEAWARAEWLAGRERPAAAFGGFDVVAALATRTTPFARALLLNNLGSNELAVGHRAEAQAAFRRALDAARGATGPGAVELTTIRRNLALVVDDAAERERMLGELRADLARLLGDGHPDTLLGEYVYATTGIEQMRAAANQLATTCARFELHELLAPLLPACLGELGDLRAELGEPREAAAAYERALAHGGATSPDVPELAGYLALWRGSPTAAIRAFDQALAAAPPQPGELFFQAYARAKLQLGRARALIAAGQPAAARVALERSLDGMREIDEHSTTSLQRRLSRARAELARVLAASRAAPDRVRTLAGGALAWYRRSGGAPAELAELARLAGSSSSSK